MIFHVSKHYKVTLLHNSLFWISWKLLWNGGHIVIPTAKLKLVPMKKGWLLKDSYSGLSWQFSDTFLAVEKLLFLSKRNRFLRGYDEHI